MKFDRDTFGEIFLTLTRNRSRSLLTAFGIFWGIFMLLALIGAGNGWQMMMKKNFEGFATNSGFLAAMPTTEAYAGFRKGRSWNLTVDDITRLQRQVPQAEIITPLIGKWGVTFSTDEKTFRGMIKGLYADYQHIESQEMKYGRFINESDVQQLRKVCVIGRRVYESLFPEGGDPCGKYVRANGIYYRIVGVTFNEGDMNINGPISESLVIPITTMQRAYNFGNVIGIICYTVRKGTKVSEIQPVMERIVKEAHYVSPTDRSAMLSLDAEALFDTVDNLFTGTRVLFWMVGLGTLLAGAIGVSNIMMVTVKERTVEIGIRRAIGATPVDILQQVITESVILTIVAGMCGISFAVLVLQGLESGVNANGGDIRFQVDFWTAIGTCALLAVLGGLAGLAPSYRAMAIKPIEAIRDE